MNALENLDRQQPRRLTRRQAEVLELVARRRTLKQIASALGISESAINLHIKALKEILGVNSLTELADAYQEAQISEPTDTYRNSAYRKSAVPDAGEFDQDLDLEAPGPVVSFHDALTYRVDAPWHVDPEPRVVPKVLSGANARLVRAAFIVGIALGMFVLVLTGLGIAQGISAALSSDPAPSRPTPEVPAA